MTKKLNKLTNQSAFLAAYGDIELSDIVNTEPFNNYDINEMFGTNINAVVEIVNVLHGSVTTDVA